MAGREPDIPREVLERAARGDARAFEAIVRRFERPVYALVFRLVGDKEAARDLAQDVFLKAWKNLARYDPERPFAPWFLKLAANLAINARAALRLRKAASLDAPLGPEGKAPEGPPDRQSVAAPEAAAGEEAREAVRRGIAELEEKYALPVALFYLEGMSVKDIALR